MGSSANISTRTVECTYVGTIQSTAANQKLYTNNLFRNHLQELWAIRTFSATVRE